MSSAQPAAPAIFIHSPMERSGSTFFRDLVCLHPDCAHVELPEDYLLYHADKLVAFADDVVGSWNPHLSVEGDIRAELVAGLGSGVVSVLRQRCAAPRPVTKTPRAKNLDLFFQVFPDSNLLIVTRDGRAACESAVASWGWDYEWAFHQWARGAAAVLEFDRAFRDRGLPYRIVRYEDLHTALERTMRGVLATCKLDDSSYDFAAANALPIHGSSTQRSEDGAFRWSRVEKTVDFDPLSRFAHWSDTLHRRFEWIAGDVSAALGYPVRNSAPPSLAKRCSHLVRDGRWRLRRSASLFKRSLARR